MTSQRGKAPVERLSNTEKAKHTAEAMATCFLESGKNTSGTQGKIAFSFSLMRLKKALC